MPLFTSGGLGLGLKNLDLFTSLVAILSSSSSSSSSSSRLLLLLSLLSTSTVGSLCSIIYLFIYLFLSFFNNPHKTVA